MTENIINYKELSEGIELPVLYELLALDALLDPLPEPVLALHT